MPVKSSGEGVDPYQALATDAGLRSILEASLYSDSVTFAAIVDADGIAVAHVDRAHEGRPLRPGGDLSLLLSRPQLSQLMALYSDQGRNLELRRPLLLGDVRVGLDSDRCLDAAHPGRAQSRRSPPRC